MSEELARARVIRDVLAHRLKDDKRVNGIRIIPVSYSVVVNVVSKDDIPDAVPDSLGGISVEVREAGELIQGG